MSSILYYSNYCDNCKILIQNISSSSVKDDMHFICIDKRNQKNGITYIELENGQDIMLPPTVNKVPALLLLNKNHEVLFGNDIMKYLEPKQIVEQNIATSNNGEPSAFSLACGNSCFGVASDNYSYLDQNSDDMSAKGSGGLRQQHHYSVLDTTYESINTPQDTYEPNKIKDVTIEQLQNQRNNDFN